MLPFIHSIICAAAAASVAVAAMNVSFDGRAFIIDGKRTLIVSGSIHYPRASSAEWENVIAKASLNGINMVETYVFWDLHEPLEGEFYFPSDGSSADIVAFLKECQRQGMYVNVRFGPYTCAEWNYGGFPAWLREVEGVTFRTMNTPFWSRVTRFVDKVVNVIRDADMFASEGGPVIMVQIENEYGNMEHYYGEDGADYVQLNAAYAKSLGLEIPWMMCQQGEGTGTAPPEDIINTCNGYYCDNWIESHAEAFPNQPHMWTENWPGWFQNWGQAVPHRPTVDVTFAVARWYAKGGTFMNYYMAFGGTTFGRHVGGPGIITSYDYDVQINEWGLEAEPKFTATRHLHEALMEVAPVVLASDQIPSPVAVALNCEQHEYGTGDNAELGCVSFLSNYGTKGSCKFTVSGTVFEVPMWSVSILKNTCDGSTPPVLLLNTRDDAVKIVQNRPQTTTVITFDNAAFKVSKESIPPTLSNPASVVSSEYPQEQLRLTGDQTDYLWYSFSINSVPEGVTSVNISYSSGAMAGSHMFAFVGGSLEATTEPSYGSGQDSGAIGIPVSFTVPVVAGDNRLDIVTVAMGLQNYGPYLEKRKAGVISNFTVSYASEDVTVVKDIDHTIGLQGEEYEFWDSSATDPAWQPLSSADCGRPFSWYRVDFDTPLDLDLKQSLAVDIVNSNSGSALGKGALWVNGFHLGRFWDVSARSYPVCETCESETYTGSYNADSCRSGCGEPSQRLYKIPQGLLRSSQSGSNSLIILQETGVSCPASAISIVSIAMTSK